MHQSVYMSNASGLGKFPHPSNSPKPSQAVSAVAATHVVATGEAQQPLVGAFETACIQYVATHCLYIIPVCLWLPRQ